MRHFLKGFCYGALGISLLLLIWLMLARPQLTRMSSATLKEEFKTTVPGANSPGDSLERDPAVDIAAMQHKYPDIKGWLFIPGTGIDYPVLQSGASDPEYYLRRNYDGTWRMAGSLFLQYDCEPSARNLVIYGHNMSDGTMFAPLPKMHNPTYLAEHSQVLLTTADGIRSFAIAAVLKTDINMLPFNRTVFQTDEDFCQFAQQMLRGTDVIPTGNLKLLTLVTCAYDWDGARTVIVAVEK